MLMEGEEGEDLTGPRSWESLLRGSPLVLHLLRQKQPLLGEGGQHHLIYVG